MADPIHIPSPNVVIDVLSLYRYLGIKSNVPLLPAELLIKGSGSKGQV